MNLNSFVYTYCLLSFFLWNDGFCPFPWYFFLLILSEIFVYIWILAFSHVSHVLCPVGQFFNYFICDFFFLEFKKFIYIHKLSCLCFLVSESSLAYIGLLTMVLFSGIPPLLVYNILFHCVFFKHVNISQM